MNNVEIDKLKETLKEYADYAIKLVKENKRLQQENQQLKEDKNKAIEYIKSQTKFEVGCDIYKHIDTNYLIKLLGGKNE